MKLIIKQFIFCLTILNIFIPILFINFFNPVGVESISTDFEISLYIKETGEIRKIPFEDYIKQVVYAEIPAVFEIEAIKAQAIATRSYTYKKLQTKAHENSDMCNDVNHCQAWREEDDTENYKKISRAIEETNGEIATYDGEIITAVYHASSGGFTEDSINVWNGQEDYLVAVESLGEDAIMKDFETIVLVSKKEFLTKLNLTKLGEIKIISKTDGNRVREVSINNKKFAGNEIRKIFGLRSSNFKIEKQGEQIKFIVKGYGHGVGLSQWGAQAMALEGKKCEEIIKYYYTGVEVVDIRKNTNSATNS